MPQCQFLFSAVFGSRKAVRAIFSEFDETKAKPPISPRDTRSQKDKPGGGPRPPDHRGARPRGGAWTWCGPPGARLRLFFGLLDGSGENRDFCLRGVQFREYFQNNFSETKNSRKQGTGTGHLVNRLVPENVGKRVKT